MKYLLLITLLFASLCAFREAGKSGLTLAEKLSAGQPVFIDGQTFEEPVDLTLWLSAQLVSEGIYQVQTASPITFRNCTFKKPVLAFTQDRPDHTVITQLLCNVSFLNCEFRDTVSFRGASLIGRSDFSRSTFLGPVNFEEATFYNQAFFNACQFNGAARWQNAVFLQKAHFMDARFERNAYFQSTVFQGDAQFSLAEFAGYADFSLIHSSQNAYFNYSSFQDRAVFNDAHFARTANFLELHVQRGSFCRCTFAGKAQFDQAHAFDWVDFSEAVFDYGKPAFALTANDD